MGAMPREVRRFFDRVSLVVGGVAGLLLLWVTGLPLMPVLVFLLGGGLACAACRCGTRRLLGAKSRRSKSRRSVRR